MPLQAAVRPAAVAGLFYPAEPQELRRMIQAMLAGVQNQPLRPGLPKAVIAPHAGYVYSGAIAASAFTGWAAEAGDIRRIVLLGPAHRVALAGLALPAARAFATPLGEVPVDGELAAAVAGLPQVGVSAAAHGPEHSLEVELPFLQTVLGRFSILPLVVGEATGEEVGEALDLVWTDPATRIVVSSDLSHYLPYDRAREQDAETASMIEALAEPIAPWRACGAAPVNGLLRIAARRGLSCQRLDLRNSGDTAGDRRQVVGYGAFLFREAA